MYFYPTMAMSKKSNKKVTKAQNAERTTKSGVQALAQPVSKTSLLSPKAHKILLFLLALVLYANTLTHDYTQDDAIVIYDNMFTQKGLAGIPGILGNDTFYGFFKEEGKAKLVTGGRYRPFTQLMFALEWQLFGRAPMVGHLINVLLYGFLGIMLYKLLVLMLLGQNKAGKKEKKIRLLVFATCLLYIAHPIHTEAVANIKGRDEIMTMLGAIIALWASLKAYHNKAGKWNIVALVSFFIALMSKENAITFLAVVPLMYLLFKKLSLINSLKQLWPFVVSTVLFLIIRTAVLGADFGGASMELMNNPFLKLSGNSWVAFSGAEKLATIFFTLGKYVWLLIFPHPLCHDYYPRAVEIMQFGDWQVIASVVLYLAMLGAAFFFWSRDKLISFGILFFIITLSIISNIVFPIGTNMSERFMFMPSLGILLVLARLLTKYVASEKVVYALLGVVVLGYSFKTITRNTVWKDDFTLFTTDVKTNTRSAKLLNAAGGALTTEAAKLSAGPEKTKMLETAIGYLTEATQIHPTYRNAYLLLGNANYYLERYEASIAQLDKAIRLYPNFEDAKRNLPIILRDAGKYYGQQKNDIATSEKHLTRSYELNPNDGETLRLLGIVSGIKGAHDQAIFYFEKALKINPQVAVSYVNLGTAYQNKGDAVRAAEYYNKAKEIDPKALDHMQGK